MPFDMLDAVFLSRLQFAFTVAMHIIFPALTIGLASWLAYLEGMWLKTDHPIYLEIYQFWVKIFAVNFGMGVVSGLVMSYQFGTNWSQFSDSVGNVIGPLLGFEVLTAFFLEASFLGIMLFGAGRVSKRMHFASTLIVAFGTLLSAFWILSANSWMQTPTGFTVGENNILYPDNWLDIVFNPSFAPRFFHMVTGAYLTTAFVIAGVAAWYMLKGRFVKPAQIMFAKTMIAIAILAPVQILIGDIHGTNTLAYQPEKVAAIEGLWDTTQYADLLLFAVPDEDMQTNHHEIRIPGLASLILTHSFDGELQGLKEFAPNIAPVAPVFYAFRIMVGIGVLMLLTGLIALFLYSKKRLFTSAWFQRWCVLMAPSGFIAVIAGWCVTEIGRQPYVVFGVLKTADMASPVPAAAVAWSLLLFVVVYLAVFGAGVYYIIRLIKKGPKLGDWHDLYGAHHVKEPATLADVFKLTH